jgi:phosphate starvation-inducible protein PhoH
MFIEKQSSIEILFEKILYFTHSNQIKRFQTRILMNSKFLIRNDEMIFDFQSDLKAF